MTPPPLFIRVAHAFADAFWLGLEIALTPVAVALYLLDARFRIDGG